MELSHIEFIFENTIEQSINLEIIDVHFKVPEYNDDGYFY